MIQAYCVKCRNQVEIKVPQSITMKDKHRVTQGVTETTVLLLTVGENQAPVAY
ncbi:hypothetical protein ACFLXE_03350 [Chloroflexota bacterium]